MTVNKKLLRLKRKEKKRLLSFIRSESLAYQKIDEGERKYALSIANGLKGTYPFNTDVRKLLAHCHLASGNKLEAGKEFYLSDETSDVAMSCIDNFMDFMGHNLHSIYMAYRFNTLPFGEFNNDLVESRLNKIKDYMEANDHHFDCKESFSIGNDSGCLVVMAIIFSIFIIGLFEVGSWVFG